MPAENLICSTVIRGYAGGNNLGIERALAAGLEYVLLLNTDAEISAAGVGLLLARLDAYTQIAIVGPVVNEQMKGRLGALSAAGISHAIHSQVSPCRLTTPRSFPSTLFTRSTMFPARFSPARSSVFKEIGLLDEEYFLSGKLRISASA